MTNGFDVISNEVSKALLELASVAGIIMIGVLALIWILGAKNDAFTKLKCVFQGIGIAVLGPSAFMLFYHMLIGLKNLLPMIS